MRLGEGDESSRNMVMAEVSNSLLVGMRCVLIDSFEVLMAQRLNSLRRLKGQAGRSFFVACQRALRACLNCFVIATF